MKNKWPLLLLAVLIICEAKAQTSGKTDKPKTDKTKDTIPVKLNPTFRNEPRTKTPPPLPATNTPAPVNNTIYYLRTAKVDIVTGNDNKEQPSIVHISLNRPGGSNYTNDPNHTEAALLFSYLSGDRNLFEFKPNSTTQLILPCLYQFPGQYEGWRYHELRLDLIQIWGLGLYIYYGPNFILDAWKVEKVTLTLTFGDVAGNPHPSMSTVIIPFNASVLLKDGNRTLVCEMDKFLMPKAVYTRKD